MGPPQYFTAGIPGAGYTPDMDANSLTGKSSKRRQPVVETSGSGKRRRVVLTNKTVPRNNLNVSEARHEVQIYDKHLLANQGTQRLTSLSLNCGSRLPVIDKYGPFLKNLNQNGRVSMNWTGIIQTTKLDERHVSMQCFRHSFSGNSSNTSQGPYPDTNKNPHILFPASQFTANVGYIPDAVGPEQTDVIKNPFYKHSAGQVSFAPLNLPDMEDMSWNLNKLKLAATDESASGPQFDGNVPVYDVNFHRRQSTLRQNNYKAVYTSDLSGTDDGVGLASNYLFDACIRYGTISYEFMNKNDTGAHVEVVVYKCKKTQPMSSDAARYQTAINLNTQSGVTTSAFYPLNYLVDGVSKGYIDTLGQDFATENFQGRAPDNLDVYNNPCFPLLPNNLKKTVQGDFPFKEVMRNKFAMSAGSRRSLSIQLPGILYNPASGPSVDAPDSITSSTSNLPYYAVPILDQHSYLVVLSVNGQKMTRFFDNKPKSQGLIVNGNTIRPYQLGLNPVTGDPFVWWSDYDASTGNSIPDGVPTTVNIASIFYPPGGAVPDITVTPMTVEVTVESYTGPTTPPAGYSRYVTYISNWQANGFTPAVNAFYGFYQQPQVVDNSGALSYWRFTMVYSNVNAVEPNELPMGDTFGLARVNYSCNYTEHIGSCVYKEVKERNLYDCGQSEKPLLVTNEGSVTSARMILPAVDVVRQAKRYGYDIDSSGNAQNFTAQESTEGN